MRVTENTIEFNELGLTDGEQGKHILKCEFLGKNDKTYFSININHYGSESLYILKENECEELYNFLKNKFE